MIADILGPANADNAVIVRPGETRTFASIDTWFQDCTTPTADDGTEIQAAWLNGMLAAARSLWRSNGLMIDNATPIVAETGTDDDGLSKAMQHLVQRSQPQYTIDTGVANAMVVALGPALKEYKQGVCIRVKVKFNNTGAATINVNGLGARNVKRTTLAVLSANDISANGIAVLVDDGTQFQLVSGGAGGGSGAQGIQGPAGSQGVPGIQGAQGIQGVVGPQGVPGTFPLTPGGIGSMAFLSGNDNVGPAVTADGSSHYSGTWQTLSYASDVATVGTATPGLSLRQRIA